MKILGIETSCDETAASIVEDGSIILSNIVASQVAIHARYGGIVPEVASRQHLLTILPVIEEATSKAGIDWQEIDALAVTYGPGLAGSLLVGVNIAKAIALAHKIQIISINHLEGHIYANWLNEKRPVFPCLCLIVSGGHTDLLLMIDHGQFTKIGCTRDDAAGEAFDKGARILGLGFPGGPAIQKCAEKGTASVSLPRSWLKDTSDFSFSGVKTALLHLVRANESSHLNKVEDIAASYQRAIVEVLTVKTIKTAEDIGVNQILLAGGVAANKELCQSFIDNSSIPVLIPPPNLCTDNAAMIAACGYYRIKSGYSSFNDIDVMPNLSIN